MSNESRHPSAATRIVATSLQKGWLESMGVVLPWLDSEDAVPTSPGQAPTVSPENVSDHMARASDVKSGKPAHLPIPSPKLAGDSVGVVVDVLPQTLDVSGMSLRDIGQTIARCDRCSLCQTREHAVPGEGSDQPTILVVGEAPGEQEDIQGKPFVGRSGQLLDNMLKAIGHDRHHDVYITNVVKCRPPANRNPRDEEILACSAFLTHQVKLLAPKAILALGRFAAHALLKTDVSLQKLRQQSHQLTVAGSSIPVVVSYHPAYLLRRPIEKALAREDLKRLEAIVQGA